ncbi:glutathione S-transferase 3-like isoform X1 [Watersipora subatra]|uniref:glutathione S-transferase 3-like isoform X1 n=1 Tax=Watersipora subatra TaxID=2589382 RepID=UPI00355C862A
MAQQDKLVYFSLKARGEPIRMLYTLAEETLGEEQLDYSQWKTLKSTVETPLGQLPTFITKDGTLCHSNTISRYAAKKFGLVGEGLWNETLNDLIVETLQEYFNNLVRRVIAWKVLKLVPEPEESEKAVQEQRADLLKRIEYIKSIADQQGKHKFLLCDKIQLADVWLYTTLEFSKSAFEDAMEITPWTKDFTTAFQANPRIKQYLAVRPESPL